MKKYDFKKIEDAWKSKWFDDNVYAAEDNSNKPKKYILAELPYPSGKMLHVGHAMRYTIPEMYSRFLRMQGFNVMFPMGWDAFGLPTEGFALKQKKTPQEITAELAVNYKKAMQDMGYAFDWDREINTTDPKMYKWTQWLFLKFYEHGLAQLKEMPVWWCKELGNLADEEILTDEDGNKISERGSHRVERKMFKQWVMKLPEYAEKLLEGLEEVEYPEHIKTAQKNWIGKSEGTQIRFDVEAENGKSVSGIEAFTTRADTLFGVTFIALAPEYKVEINKKDRHEWLEETGGKTTNSLEILKFIEKCQIENLEEVRKYTNKAKNLSDMEKQTVKEKTGILVKGIYAIHPLTGERLPIYITNYVLIDYGTGAVMGVPAHDKRDHEFALKYGIDIPQVIKPTFAAYLIIEKSLPKEKVKELEAYGGVKIEKVSADWGKFYRVSVPIEKEESFGEFLKENLIRKSANNSPWYADSTGTTNKVVFPDKIIDVSTVEGMAEFKDYGLSVGIPKEQLDITIKPHTQKGTLINSGEFDGLTSQDAIEKITTKLAELGHGEKKTTYKVRDWVFSRQHYWGEPIPTVYKESGEAEAIVSTENMKAVHETLPLELPYSTDYEPMEDGSAPLARMPEWVQTKDAAGNPATRETQTMPTWAGSSWYYIRYIDPKNEKEFCSMEKMKYWLPVDHYFGGSEHTTVHLLYSRFWHRFFYDIGIVPTKEPYQKRTNGGLLMAADGKKMSKRLGNVVEPGELIKKYGADATRMAIAFLGPYTETYPWNEGCIRATSNLLATIDTLRERVAKEAESDTTVIKAYHKMVGNITRMMENRKMNTGVSEIMIFVNEIKGKKTIGADIWNGFVRVLAPFAPFVAEDLWQELKSYKEWKLGNSVHLQEWPKFDAEIVKEEFITIPVQINGKVRAEIEINAEEDEKSVREKVMKNEKVQEWIGEKEIKRFMYVSGKIVSLVI
jgi:leucyl-tRNA synthetase